MGKLLNVRMGNGIFFNLPYGIPYIHLTLNLLYVTCKETRCYGKSPSYIDDDRKSMNQRDK